MMPGRRPDHPALRRARPLPPGERAERRDHRLHHRPCCRSRVWTLRGFILGIPKDLEEAAMVDGSTRLGAFVRILLPLVAPGLVATSVFAFITSWNEYIFARILLNDQSKQTVTVWLSYFLGTSRHTDWGALMAGSTLTAIPVVVFFLLVQRQDRVRADRRRGDGLVVDHCARRLLVLRRPHRAARPARHGRPRGARLHRRAPHVLGERPRVLPRHDARDRRGVARRRASRCRRARGASAARSAARPRAAG